MNNPIKLLALLALLPLVAFAQPAHLITLDELVPKDQQESMGIQKLTKEEKESLRQQILALITSAAYAIRVVDARLATNSSSGLPNRDAVSDNAELSGTSKLSSQKAPAAPASKRYAGKGEGHWVKQNVDRGAFILLEEGSLWEVAPSEKLDASLWLALSSITVVESSGGSLGYDYLLINTDDGEKAHAKYIGHK
jgi:hypothetical protein